VHPLAGDNVEPAVAVDVADVDAAAGGVAVEVGQVDAAKDRLRRPSAKREVN